MVSESKWNKGLLTWNLNNSVYVSVVFTWHLPKLLKWFSGLKRVYVGGPAVRLMPHYFDDLTNVKASTGDYPGVLQKFNSDATQTSIGCVRRCGFCAVPLTEGKLQEFSYWINKPIVIDNNLLACSSEHFDLVMDKLEALGQADFNQGLDCRLLTDYHASRMARIKKSLVRIALDSMNMATPWEQAFDCLLRAGIAKSKIRSYALIGYDSPPDEAWQRCNWIEKHKIKALPMWFHPLDAMKLNAVTDKQKELGWDDFERRKIMQWFYKHKKAVK